MKNILVTIDFEKKGQLLIEKAAEIAVKFGAKLWLVHVAAPDPEFIGYEVGPQYVRDVLAKDLREEHKLLQKFSAQLKEKNIGVLITDHNVHETLSITERAYLLYDGNILKSGTAEELAADEEVRRLYLGKNIYGKH